MVGLLVVLFAGALFGLGLAVLGMMNLQKIIGFLDVAGDWDPTLMFVMAAPCSSPFPRFV